MPESTTRSKGRPQGYKFDRGGTPAEFGPFIGLVKNNVDPTRSGRLQVYIEQFAGENEDDESLWRTVSYIPPFYGVTPHSGTAGGVGTYPGNQNSYGMWFTPPDLGTQVICFFVSGDPNQGYYTGCVPDPGINHMIPAIGASRKFQLANGPQDSYFAGASQLPVTEINSENTEISQDPRFFDKPKPVQSYFAGVMMQQGLIKDLVRGPITSNSQRESPSAVFGISTPGKAIYQGGLDERAIKGQLERGQLRPQDVEVIARRGGHSIVMDDGDLEGKDTLIRIRTAKGHQITMSDDGDCFYIIHANGQTWLEFGKQGTVDVFSTNSVNVRTQGTINLHADKDINMYAGGSINVKTKLMKLEADASMDIIGTGKMTLYSKNLIGIKSDGSLALKNSSSGSWDAGSAMTLKAGCINLNSGGAAPVSTPTSIKDLSLADTAFVQNQGWKVEYGKLKTIVTRAPTHEPYPYHNQGTSSVTELTQTPPVDLNQAQAKTLESLQNVPVTSPIDVAGYLEQSPAEISVGSLDTGQVTGLMAQMSSQVGQPFDVVSLDKGIGQFGFNASQLEGAGFLKPGTVQTFLKDPAQLESVLSSPAVWTGKAGVGNLSGLLSDPKLQSLTQNEIMVSALQGLQQTGIVTGRESPSELAGFVQAASKFGVADTVAWVKGNAPADLVTEINSVAKGAQYAVSFVDTRVSDVISGVQLGGFSNTVERGALDQALSDVIGNPKIPVPDYSSGLFSSVPDGDLFYGDDTAEEDVQRIEEERESRGLAPIETSSGSSGETVRRSAESSAAAQQITLLNNEISDLESVIRGRLRRGQDVTQQVAELEELRRRLSRLQGVA